MKKIAILLVSAVLLPLVSCEKDTQTPTPTNVPVTGVELNVAELELVVGETAVLTATVLPENATDKNVTWLSSAPEIVSVDENGTVEGLAAGNTTVTATATDGGKTAECQIQVVPATVSVTGVELDVTELELEVGQTQGLAVGDAVITVTTTDGGKTAECIVTVPQTINGHEYVDLGLSVKWATCNVGAENPWDYGDYFAWGETEVKEEYTEDNSITYKIEMSEISGNPEYDAARSKWGGTWRMPAHDETLELLEECTWEWVEEQGVPGYKVTGLNGNTIFLPAGGYYDGFDSSEPYNFGTRGYYWSSTPDESSFETAYNFFFTKSVCGWRADFRFTGQNIRPVSD